MDRSVPSIMDMASAPTKNDSTNKSLLEEDATNTKKVACVSSTTTMDRSIPSTSDTKDISKRERVAQLIRDIASQLSASARTKNYSTNKSLLEEDKTNTKKVACVFPTRKMETSTSSTSETSTQMETCSNENGNRKTVSSSLESKILNETKKKKISNHRIVHKQSCSNNANKRDITLTTSRKRPSIIDTVKELTQKSPKRAKSITSDLERNVLASPDDNVNDKMFPCLQDNEPTRNNNLLENCSNSSKKDEERFVDFLTLKRQAFHNCLHEITESDLRAMDVEATKKHPLVQSKKKSNEFAQNHSLNGNIEKNLENSKSLADASVLDVLQLNTSTSFSELSNPHVCSKLRAIVLPVLVCGCNDPNCYSNRPPDLLSLQADIDDFTRTIVNVSNNDPQRLSLLSDSALNTFHQKIKKSFDKITKNNCVSPDPHLTAQK